MNRMLRTLTLALTAAAALSASPAFAQKNSGPAPVVEVEKAARTAVNVLFNCNPAAANNEARCSTDYQVPSGMRLVIQDVQIMSYAPANGGLFGTIYHRIEGVPLMTIIPPTRTLTSGAFAAREVPTFVDELYGVFVFNVTQGHAPIVQITAYLVQM